MIPWRQPQALGSRRSQPESALGCRQFDDLPGRHRHSLAHGATDKFGQQVYRIPIALQGVSTALEPGPGLFRCLSELALELSQGGLVRGWQARPLQPMSQSLGDLGRAGIEPGQGYTRVSHAAVDGVQRRRQPGQLGGGGGDMATGPHHRLAITRPALSQQRQHLIAQEIAILSESIEWLLIKREWRFLPRLQVSRRWVTRCAAPATFPPER